MADTQELIYIQFREVLRNAQRQGGNIDEIWASVPDDFRAGYNEWLAGRYISQSQKQQVPQNKTYTSFSGADIVASIRPLGGKPVVFGEIQTISYSIYRPMMPVHALGRINPRGVVRGPRTIAGTLIFTVFDRHVLKNIMDKYRTEPDSFRTSFGLTEDDIIDLRNYAKTDEMPPFDINISFMNEYGNSATLNIYGVHIMSEGQTMSVEDMITENTMQYIAMDIDLMDYNSFESASNPF